VIRVERKGPMEPPMLSVPRRTAGDAAAVVMSE